MKKRSVKIKFEADNIEKIEINLSKAERNEKKTWKEGGKMLVICSPHK